ncbi:putative nicotinamide mononucleotide transporter [Actinoplanes missouriensis 431]|uniref:Putative nicotinamide mononucleotide transporter n=1 Tax=Actinoplanes missouriensis (strain ATCC 14538 / DSM 43046 / CBS 188.64 / JCM 3121 / NBRC 102363 / NCIMB 12654 / NRRL B-3342 / UNCC 431) TaxID=512565 RepID=I0HFD3_ACTM4|nr:nicotinamide riboside transporter PnuC [Actinoplanes missouriensis]BAL91720.1 putative nicotinamide mononucleotide transporter [Actinoplanes missouriensis 431]
MTWIDQLLSSFYHAKWQVTADQAIYWREIVGNAFGLGSALFGLRRSYWAWPVGIVGNLLLFTVFLGQALGNDQGTPLYGQAARQVFFLATSVYGWWAWQRNRRRDHGTAVIPRWAGHRQRMVLIPVALAAVGVCFVVFREIGAGFPVPWWYYLADSWIFVGSILATYAMARGWVEFWLCWIAVDLVGVPELIHFGYYPSAILYAVYALFVIWGFVVWLRISRTVAAPQPDVQPAAARR